MKLKIIYEMTRSSVLCRGAPALTACGSRSRRSPLPGCGRGVVAEGEVCGLAASMTAPERAAAEPYPPYSLRLVAAAQVSRDAPPLPGGYTVGDRVFFTRASQTFENGYELVHGQHGKVMGPDTSVGTPLPDMGVGVLFPGYKGIIDCPLGMVRRPRAASAATPRLTPASAPQLSSAGGYPHR